MRLSKHATMPVNPSDAWKSIAMVVVLLVGIGLCQTQHWHIPGGDLWFWVGTLLWVWGLALFAVFKFGWQVFRSQQGACLTAYTFFAGGHLLPHLPVIISWLSNAGLLVIIGVTLSPYVEFGRRNERASVESHSNSAGSA